ncbi:MAG TPA: glycoside hydrolase family 3 C-terminal domain-containing protein, partial [Steroidobacteraceae bacterium]|nr:glycoside hydrolase family 3 C-terminal domain-containing protein [Steroidobacteraceae bacterium]
IGGYADKGVLAGGGSSLVYPVGGNAMPNIHPTSWPGPVMYYPSSPLVEIRRLAPEATVIFQDGADQNTAVRTARNCDIAIVFATQWTGESFDVTLSVDTPQDQLITAVASANPRTIVVLETGGPVLMPWANLASAIVEAWYPGTSGGTAIANILFGKINPSGHLSATFPRSLDQLPHPNAPVSGETRYTEGAAVGYKWFDLKNQNPLFAFGYGLSYSTFEYSGLSASSTKQFVTARFSARNSGAREGMAVPQIYVSGEGWEAPKRLGAWKKLSIAAGATQSVEVAIDPRLFAKFDTPTNSWKIAAGTYRLMLGSSAQDIRETVTVQLTATTLPAGWRPNDK